MSALPGVARAQASVTSTEPVCAAAPPAISSKAVNRARAFDIGFLQADGLSRYYRIDFGDQMARLRRLGQRINTGLGRVEGKPGDLLWIGCGDDDRARPVH